MNIETIAADGSRVLIVDDQPHIVRMLTSVLADQGYLVQSADEGKSALASFTAWRPELVITDLYLRHIDGLELCRRIRAQSKVPIIVLSDTHEEESKVEALDSGADDYVTKPFASGELLARVRATLRRSGGESGAGSFDAGDFVVHPRPREVRLTPKEFALFTYMARHPNRVLGHRQLLEAVWGDASREQPQYLRVYMGQLRKKLEPEPSRPRYLVTEAWVGYTFRPQGAPR